VLVAETLRSVFKREVNWSMFALYARTSGARGSNDGCVGFGFGQRILYGHLRDIAGERDVLWSNHQLSQRYSRS
jgi:hypothetical protein